MPGGLLVKHDVPLWDVQKIVQMMMIRHFEHEKMISPKGKTQRGDAGLTLISSNCTLNHIIGKIMISNDLIVTLKLTIKSLCFQKC